MSKQDILNYFSDINHAYNDSTRLDTLSRMLDELIEEPASPWHKVEEEGLPKETRCYIVYLRQGTEVETPEWMGGEPLSYVTEMGFEKGQMLWRDGDDAYNASLSLVNTAHEFHVTHWMEKPKPPEENDDSCR